MHHKAKQFVWVSVLFCLGQIAFAQGNSPEQTARDYLKALEDMDYAKAYGMTASIFMDLITEAEFRMICSPVASIPVDADSNPASFRKIAAEACRPVSVALHSVGSSQADIAHYRYTVFVSPFTTVQPPRIIARPPQEARRELIDLCRQCLTIEQDESRRSYIQKQIELIEKGLPVNVSQTDLILGKRASTGEWRVLPLCGVRRQRELKLDLLTHSGEKTGDVLFSFPDPTLEGFILKDLNTPIEYVFRTSLLVNPGVCTKCKKKEPLDPYWKYCPYCGKAMPKKN